MAGWLAGDAGSPVPRGGSNRIFCGMGKLILISNLGGCFSKHSSSVVGREVAAPLQLPNQQSALERNI